MGHLIVEYLGYIVYFIFIFALLVTVLIKRHRQVGRKEIYPTNIEVENKILECQHCGNDKFLKREGILVTTLIAFFLTPWWNESARCFVCSKCGFVHWFLNRNEKIVSK